MLELYDIGVMRDITAIIESSIESNGEALTEQQRFDTLLKIRQYLNACRYDDSIIWVNLSQSNIKKLYKIYVTRIKDESYVTHIKNTEIIWSHQRGKFIVNDNDILYYSLSDTYELICYIIHKLGSTEDTAKITNMFAERMTSIQPFHRYLMCCNYIHNIHRNLYNLSLMDWFTTQMKLCYGSDAMEASNE